jgi:hypothetical protein
MEEVLDKSSEMNSEESDKNIILKLNKVAKKINNLDLEPSLNESDIKKEKKERPKLYSQIVEILKENCNIDAKKYIEGFEVSKYQRKLSRRELNPKDKWD